MPCPIAHDEPLWKPPSPPSARARRRDARADPQLGRDQQLHREHRGRERGRRAARARRSRCRRSPARRSPAATATAITSSGAPRPPGAPIVLVGHHDTVFPPGHFEGWREEGGRAIGPGALDMKGGLAIIRARARGARGRRRARDAADRGRLRRRRRGRLADVRAAPAASSRRARRARSCSSRAAPNDIDHHAAQGRRRDDGRRARQGRARRQRPQGRRERDLGAREVRRRGAAAHRLRARRHRQRRPVHAAARRRTPCPSAPSARSTCATRPSPTPRRWSPQLRAAAEAAARSPGVAHRGASGGANRLPLERTAASAALRDEYAACARAAGPRRRRGPAPRRRLGREHRRAARRARRSTASARAAPASTRRPSTSSSRRSCPRPRRSLRFLAGRLSDGQ